MKRFFNNIADFIFGIWYYIGLFGIIYIYGNCVLIKAYFMRKSKGDEITDKYIRKVVGKFGRGTYNVIRTPVEIINKEKIPQNDNYVIVSNHQSYFDIPLILGFVYASGFLAKKELGNFPVVGKFMKDLGSILIDRNDPKSGAASLRKFAKSVKSGKIITIFPEGTRSLDGKVDEFKKGTLMVPYRYKANILPVTINGTLNISKRGTYIFKRSKNVSIKIHDIVNPENFASEGELREHLRSIISNDIKI